MTDIDTDYVLQLARKTAPEFGFYSCSFDEGSFFLIAKYEREIELDLFDTATDLEIINMIEVAINDVFSAEQDYDTNVRSERAALYGGAY